MKYFKKKTDVPLYDNILNKPKYHREEKGFHYKIVEMLPDDYMKEVAIQQKTSIGRQYESISPKLVKEYKERTLKGSPMPMLSLETYESGFQVQEGRHRAMVAKELGIKKVPVMKIWRK